MHVEIDSMLRVHGADPALESRLRTLATFPNPARKKAEGAGRWAGNVPEHLDLSRFERGALVVPRGLVGELRRLAPICAVRDCRLGLPSVAFAWRGSLRAEQKQAARAVFDAGGGVLVAPPGSGKTVLGLALVAAWRQPTLWLVHTLDLAQQALERARTLFDLPPEAFGLLGGGKESIGSHLTIATVQTLARRDLAELAGRFGAVVLDEAHHAPASSFLQVVQAFPARHRLGLTATPRRADGLGPVMSAVLGPIAARLSTAELVAAHQLIRPDVVQVVTSFEHGYTDDWNALMGAVTTDEVRNRLIVETIAAEAVAGRACLVLTERVAHARLLADLIAAAFPQVPVAALTGEATAKRRAAVLEDARAGRMPVLVATKVADEGLDIPRLDRIFLATAGRSASRVSQQIGRAMRTAAGKTGAVIVDFIDPGCPVLAAQARARESSVYRPLGARIRRSLLPVRRPPTNHAAQRPAG